MLNFKNYEGIKYSFTDFLYPDISLLHNRLLRDILAPSGSETGFLNFKTPRNQEIRFSGPGLT